MQSALEQTHCGRCEGVLRRDGDGVVTCTCENPMYGGMVSLSSDGLAVCYSCGWQGVLTFVKDCWSTHCPSCEGFGDEPDLREHPLAYDIHVRRDGVFREENGRPVRRGTPKPQAPKQGRNELCYCGSGLKVKRCHGA